MLLGFLRTPLFAVLSIPAFAAGPFVILIGSPAAGIPTQAEILHRDLGIAVISADELIANNRDRFERYNKPVLTGVEPRLDPALNTLVEDALKKADVSKGIVLEDYPSSKPQADYLTGLRDKLKLPKALVIHLKVPDDEARRRLSQQKATDIDQQLKDYHREFDFANLYFPDADLQSVDATKPPEAIAAEIRKLLESRGLQK